MTPQEKISEMRRLTRRIKQLATVDVLRSISDKDRAALVDSCDTISDRLIVAV